MKLPPFTDDEKKSAIKWVNRFNENKGKTFCTICEEFNCSCSSSDCFKITNSESVIAFLRYVYSIREDEIEKCNKTGNEAYY